MTPSELNERTHHLKFAAGTNLRYHQKLAFYWGWADRAIKIAVGVTAVVGMCLSVSGSDYAAQSNFVGWVSLGVAVALNVLPIGDYEKNNLDLFRRWSELYKQVQMVRDRFILDGARTVSPETRNRIADAIDTEHSLHAAQTMPFMPLWKQCEREELTAIYGVPTFKEAQEVVAANALPVIPLASDSLVTAEPELAAASG